MTSLDNDELYRKYYQAEYDFNTCSLTEAEVNEIKRLSREKRVNYANSPIGGKIFNVIAAQEPNIAFESVVLKSDIDGMLYIPQTDKQKAITAMCCYFWIRLL